MSERAFPPFPFWDCCCIVLMVSNGARRVLEQPAANADAAAFLIPLIVANDLFLVLQAAARVCGSAPPLVLVLMRVVAGDLDSRPALALDSAF